LAKEIGCEWYQFSNYCYSDGEPAPKINADYKDLKDKNISVVAPRLQYPTTPEEIALNIHNLTRVVSNLSDKGLYGAKWVEVVLPFFVFGRQDVNPRTDPRAYTRKRDRGKDVGYKSLIKTLKGNGADRIITFDPHFCLSEEKYTVDGFPILCMSGINSIRKYFECEVFEGKLDINTIVLGRDKKAESLAEILGGNLGLRAVSLDKERLGERKVRYKEKYDVKGNNVIIIDDLTTGLGIPAVLKTLKNPGDIYFSVIHSTLCKEGEIIVKDLLRRKKIREYVATNTTISEFSKADVMPELVDFYLH